ncbi:hypothetical protein OHR68_09840 [Spirillospora sp. NBC_00431]
MTTIWHYTCDHGVDGIRREGVVKPNAHPLLDGLPISWFTNLERCHRFEAGLTADWITCDRMAYRFEVKAADSLEWWPRAARRLRVPRDVRDGLEIGRLPAHWWVSLQPVAVVT